MSVEATLIIAKQMYDVACLPRMAEAETGMNALVDSLKHFCSSPDSRVRFYACKTVAALAKGYTEILMTYNWDWLVSSQAKLSTGCNDGDSDNSLVLLEALATLGVKTVEGTRDFVTPLATASAPESDVEEDNEYLDEQLDVSLPEYITEERSQKSKINTILFRLDRADETDLAIPSAAIQTRLVTVPGVLSAFINAEFLVLTVRGPLKKDQSFISEVCVNVAESSEHLFKAVLFEEDEKIVTESTKAGSETNEPIVDASYLDDDERLAVRAGVKGGKGPMPPPAVFNFFTAAPNLYVNGLNTAVAYARDLEVIEFNTPQVNAEKAAEKVEEKKEQTKKKLGFFKRWFGRG